MAGYHLPSAFFGVFKLCYTRQAVQAPNMVEQEVTFENKENLGQLRNKLSLTHRSVT